MRKYAQAEGEAEVLSPEAHQKAEEELRRLGKTSAKELDDDQRAEFSDLLESE